MPPTGAISEIAIVQALLPGAVTNAGEQLRLEVCAGGACTFRAAVTVLPFSPAVRVTTAELDTAAAEAENIALVCPDVTVTLAGTVTLALLLDSRTGAPPMGAAGLTVTVQLAVAGPGSVDGVQLRLVTRCCGGDTLSCVAGVFPVHPSRKNHVDRVGGCTGQGRK